MNTFERKEALPCLKKPETLIGGSLKQVGSECPLAKCPPGLFLSGETLGFMTEYGDVTGPEAYVVASGEYFWGGTTTADKRLCVMVVPVVFIPNSKLSSGGTADNRQQTEQAARRLLD